MLRSPRGIWGNRVSLPGLVRLSPVHHLCGRQQLGWACPTQLQRRRQGSSTSAAALPAAGVEGLAAAPLATANPIAMLAMVNVDFASPSLVLGVVLIGWGVVLLQVGAPVGC
jgi:hypothetical protein